MQIDIVTIFPDFFRGPLDFGIIRRAREAGLVKIEIRDLRAFTRDRHHTVDDRPFGGGEGMVLKPEPLFESVEALNLAPREERAAAKQSVVLLSAQGRRFDQSLAAELASLDQISPDLRTLRRRGRARRNASRGSRNLDRGLRFERRRAGRGGDCGYGHAADSRGRWETKLLRGRNRFLSGPDLGSSNGADSTCGSGGLLDYPHYTRPAEFRGLKVPDVLMSGNHEDIRRWRRKSALEKTLRNRPDLLDQAELSDDDKRIAGGNCGVARVDAMRTAGCSWPSPSE